MNKKSVAALALTMCVSAAATVAFAEVNPAVEVNDRELVFADQKAVILENEGRTVVPARGVFEYMGASVSWDDTQKKVTIKTPSPAKQIELTIGSDKMYVYTFSGQNLFAAPAKEEITLDAPARIMNDRTMIPLRAIAESMGADVTWNDTEKKVVIYTADYKAPVIDAEAPAPTDAPTSTDAPVSTDTPTSTDAPVSTDTPASTDAPVSTDTPVSTDNEVKKDIALSLSADVTEANIGDEVEITVNAKNMPKNYFVNGYTLGLVYDHSKLEMVSNSLKLVKGDVSQFMSVENPTAKDDLYKGVGITVDPNVYVASEDGAFFTFKVKVLTDDEASIKISNRYDSKRGDDTSFNFVSDTGELIDDLKIYIDTTPIVIK